jgi:hypothetical protein
MTCEEVYFEPTFPKYRGVYRVSITPYPDGCVHVKRFWVDEEGPENLNTDWYTEHDGHLLEFNRDYQQWFQGLEHYTRRCYVHTLTGIQVGYRVAHKPE